MKNKGEIWKKWKNLESFKAATSALLLNEILSLLIIASHASSSL